MRVIKEGHISERFTFCNHCGAELGYYPHDINRKQLNGFEFFSLKCPVCGEHIILDKIKIKE